MTSLTNLEQDETVRRRATRELVAYFALAFAITWGLGVVVIFFRPQFEAVFGPLGPLITSWPYYVGVCAPTISAVLVSLMFGGLNGVKGLFGGLVRPFKIQWAFVALLTMAGGYAVWGVVERSLSGITPSVDFHALLVSAPLLLFTTANIFVDPGPWGEETGWRGFALPRLLTLHSPLTAALILGVIWGIWHTPAFLASGLTQSGMNFAWFLVGSTCLTILMTWIYVNANGNYLVAGFIPHMMANLLFSAHVVTNVKIEALVFIVIVAVILAVSGPNLKGFRFARPKAAET
ncbi:MAG TPA: CPBP family intramembrane glutamic endopeptidase [Rhizomicrobium sp.]|nr:CPBP family intramembrane glutamic endopeptidase [Rhizomicrobium sp.]